MPRFSLCAVVLAAALVAPAAASADLFDAYSRLDRRDLSPAPLVFTTGPKSVGALGAAVDHASATKKNGYALTLSSLTGSARVYFERGRAATLARLLRAEKREGFGGRGTRVRGHAGYSLTSKRHGLVYELIWSEGGQAYALETITPKKVSRADLKKTAAGLEPLRGMWSGSAGPGSSSSAVVVVTPSTIAGDVGWDAVCTTPGYPGTTPGAGNVNFAVVPIRAGAFTVDLAAHRDPDGNPWTGTVHGTISGDTITLEIHATGPVEGMTCDSGTQTYTLQPGS